MTLRQKSAGTTGSLSKQDYCTPDDFLAVVAPRFGPISFDLAAHAGNKKHERYFAPPEFHFVLPADDLTWDHVVMDAARMMAGYNNIDEVNAGIFEAEEKGDKVHVTVENGDPNAVALDSLKQDWHKLEGLLWLNCEFKDISPWAEKCGEEAAQGAHVLLLTPAQVGANWYRDHIAGLADVFFLNGRLSFDGKNPFPKDCMLSYYYPEASGTQYVWDWKSNKVLHRWKYDGFST